MKLKYLSLFIVFFLLLNVPTWSYEQPRYPSSTIYHQLLKLRETKRVLYIAAHPDDENTRLIAYLGNHVHAEVGYLSLTRGDGGQNLIGKELGVELGMIRTQELLRARETDGGQQFFSRAIDFGYSKNPDETLNNWDKEKLLADVVWMIRNFQPDIIINRFNTTPGVTHGHHTTSAILSLEAFKAAADPTVFPDQLDMVEPWQAKRVFWNAYNWRAPYQPEEGKLYHAFETGAYDDLLGVTYAQIAADSRTMHKSQGFGSTAPYGGAVDFIELVDGARFEESPFEGIPNRWDEVNNGQAIQDALDEAVSQFDFVHLENNLPRFLVVKQLLGKLAPSEKWLKEKQQQIDDLIIELLGLKVDFTAAQQEAYLGEEIEGTLVVNNPSSINVKVQEFTVMGTSHSFDKAVNDNAVLRDGMALEFAPTMMVSQPYWIENPPQNNLYQVKDQEKIGKPFNDPTFNGRLKFQIEGEEFNIEVPLKYKYNDPVDGEVNQPFVLLPPVQVSIDHDQVYVLSDKAAEFSVKVSFGTEILPGDLQLQGLKESAYKVLESTVNEAKKEKTYRLSVNGDTKIGKTVVTAQYITADGNVYEEGVKHIDYKHIPALTYFPKANFDLIKLNLKTTAQNIGYIPGAGDDVPEVLRNLGYAVTELETGSLDAGRLGQFSTVIVGIRAFNVNQQVVDQFDQLMKYVENGGNLILQYNTTASLKTDRLGPYPFDITRKRVAVERAPVEVDFDAHPALQGPNAITMEDFDGWIQERGLYFTDNWDEHYVTPLSMHDPGESASEGSLLLANYGKGTYTYSGISWFRLLPAGVPGAIKLFVNLIEQNHE
ncbi:PIG-L family deacetylase [Echinicola strongylocentroti]|uniref:PIG-L family deacetylase n=1 Tax=Echinicola strongylocentroti TaxID=1795355 RepID=A0A2Z4IE68_9BACT|nr:PIG-L family deacetylase [Echinicola strongylocentroti]AWW28723.1 PIG-L family deacetylase [Echinicola strongylocentroti]